MKKKSFLLIISFVLCMLTGCASGISIRQMQEENENFTLPVLPEKDNAMVYIVRPWAFRGGLGRFNVFLDSKEESSEAGFTKNGRFIYFSVTPGIHTIYSKAQFWESISIIAEPGSCIFLKLTPSLGIFMPNSRFELISEIEGKYLVNNSKKGTINKEKK